MHRFVIKSSLFTGKWVAGSVRVRVSVTARARVSVMVTVRNRDRI